MIELKNQWKRIAGVLLATGLVVSACSSSNESTSDGSAGSEDAAAAASDYLGSYTLDDEEFGTQVSVTVDGETRTIVTNAMPDHDTGEFPNDGNPNTISAQDLTYEYPTEATFIGDASEVRTTGVAVNGVKFEPGTAETVSCSSGETYRVEALQDIYDLGLDFNNAHVQPTGEYHYHGASELLAEAYETDDDLVHVGFAADGYLITTRSPAPIPRVMHSQPRPVAVLNAPDRERLAERRSRLKERFRTER